MAVIERRTFYGKAGAADELVSVVKEMYGLVSEARAGLNVRVLTDHYSGRTDRVVAEVEMDSIADMEATVEQLTTAPGMEEKFQATFAKLQQLIDYAEVEFWQVQ